MDEFLLIGKKYCYFQIILPSGVKIKIYKGWADFYNVDIVPSVLLWEGTEGLCGYYDGNPNNDQIPKGAVVSEVGCNRKFNSVHKFAKTWK